MFSTQISFYLIFLIPIAISQTEDENDWRKYRIKKLKNSTSLTNFDNKTKFQESFKNSFIQTKISNITKEQDNLYNKLNKVMLSTKSQLVVNVVDENELNKENYSTPIITIVEKEAGINNNHANIFATFDRYTVMLVVAFLIGLFLIGILISVALCICKSCNRIKKVKTSKCTITNPLYDRVQSKQNVNDLDDLDENSEKSNELNQPKQNLPEHQLLLVKKSELILVKDENNLTPTIKYKKKKIQPNDSSLLDSSFSCSTNSMNSVVLKTPISIFNQSDIKSPDSGKIEVKTTLNSSNLKLSINDSINNKFKTPTKNIKDDTINNENEFSFLLNEINTNEQNQDNIKIPKFSHQKKSNQQLSREQKITDKVYKRTQSESNEFNEIPNRTNHASSSNRLSLASSRSSIQFPSQPISFDQIKDDIDDLAENKNKLKFSRSNLTNSQNISQIIDMDDSHPSDSINNSIADIYIKELINKHEETKNKSKFKPNLINVSINSSTSESNNINNNNNINNKRHSINVLSGNAAINFDPNPTSNITKNVTNLNKFESVSTNTMESEKSCY